MDDEGGRVPVMLRLPASTVERIDRTRAPGVGRATAILQLVEIGLDRLEVSVRAAVVS